MDLFDSILWVVQFVVGWYIGCKIGDYISDKLASYIANRAKNKFVEENPGMAEYVDAEQHGDKPETILTIEEVIYKETQSVFLLRNALTNEFYGQGLTIAEIHNLIKEKFKNHDLWFVSQDGESLVKIPNV